MPEQLSGQRLGSEKGQGMVEYALVISLLVILVIVAFPGLKTALINMYNGITAAVIQ